MSDTTNRKLHIVFLSGAGGVGKTSVANMLGEVCNNYKIELVNITSTTRSTYARLGVSDEYVARSLDDAEKLKLQTAILDDYLINLQGKVEAAIDAGVDIVVVDRSPYDHLSYLLQLMPTLDLKFIEDKLSYLMSFNQNLVRTRHRNDIDVQVYAFIWLFAYPTAWAAGRREEDGFRHAPAAKNYVWGHCLQSMLMENIHAFFPGNPRGAYLHKFQPYDTSTPKDRAFSILRTLELIKSPPSVDEYPGDGWQ